MPPSSVHIYFFLKCYITLKLFTKIAVVIEQSTTFVSRLHEQVGAMGKRKRRGTRRGEGVKVDSTLAEVPGDATERTVQAYSKGMIKSSPQTPFPSVRLPAIFCSLFFPVSLLIPFLSLSFSPLPRSIFPKASKEVCLSALNVRCCTENAADLVQLHA